MQRLLVILVLIELLVREDLQLLVNHFGRRLLVFVSIHYLVRSLLRLIFHFV